MDTCMQHISIIRMVYKIYKGQSKKQFKVLVYKMEGNL